MKRKQKPRWRIKRRKLISTWQTIDGMVWKVAHVGRDEHDRISGLKRPVCMN